MMSLLLLRYLSATAIAAATTTHSSLVVIFRFYNRIFAAAATVQCKVWEGHNRGGFKGVRAPLSAYVWTDKRHNLYIIQYFLN